VKQILIVNRLSAEHKLEYHSNASVLYWDDMVFSIISIVTLVV